MEFVISHVVGLQCFIAMEMVDWLLEYVDGIESRQQAVKFAQVSTHNTYVLMHVHVCVQCIHAHTHTQHTHARTTSLQIIIKLGNPNAAAHVAVRPSVLITVKC